MSAHELILLSPYRYPAQYALTLADEDMACWLNAYTALWHPALLWQASHGFPMLEILRNGQHGKNVVLSPGEYLFAEVLVTNPILALIWIAGLFQLLADEQARPLGLSFLILLAAMIASHAKHYYPADIYPVLFAAGGVLIERLTARFRALRPAALGLSAIAGAIALPYVVPILPLPAFLAYRQLSQIVYLVGSTNKNVRLWRDRSIKSSVARLERLCATSL